MTTKEFQERSALQIFLYDLCKQFIQLLLLLFPAALLLCPYSAEHLWEILLFNRDHNGSRSQVTAKLKHFQRIAVFENYHIMLPQFTALVQHIGIKAFQMILETDILCLYLQTGGNS